MRFRDLGASAASQPFNQSTNGVAQMNRLIRSFLGSMVLAHAIWRCWQSTRLLTALAAVAAAFAVPQTGHADDYVKWTVEQMDRFNIDKALIGWNDNATSRRAKEMYGDRFFFDLPCDPNKGMDEVRRIKRIHAEVGLSAISVFPAGTLPQVAINHKYMFPLYTVAVLMSFLATRFGTTVVYGQSRGVYDHYFSTFLQPSDLMWSFLAALSMAAAVMAIHTYYGFTADGGPAGVGEAVGRAVRTSVTATVFVLLTITLSVYGQSGNFHLSG